MKEKSQTQKRQLGAFFAVLAVGFCILYGVYLFGCFTGAELDSDYASLVLEANDILHGNVFLSGWNLTGLTFLTTDLLFFVAATIFGGSSVFTYYLAVTLMFLAAMAAACLLLPGESKRQKAVYFILLLSIAGIPTVAATRLLRAHTPVAMYLLLSLYFAQKWTENGADLKQNRRFAALYVLCIALAVLGDPLALVMCVLPVICIGGYRLLRVDTQNRKAEWMLVCLSVCGAILGKAGEKIYLLLGNANRNDFVSNTSFTPFEQLGDKIALYFDSLFTVTGARFFGYPIFTRTGLGAMLHAAVLLFGLGVILKTLIDFFLRKPVDRVNVHLSILFVVLSVLFIGTSISVDINSARYFATFHIFLAIIVVRFLHQSNWVQGAAFVPKLPMRAVLCFCGVVLLLFSARVPHYNIAPVRYEPLVNLLAEKGLTQGYSDFWEASSVTLCSSENARVRAVVYDGADNKLKKYNWYCKDAWYEETGATFMIVSKNVDTFGINEANIKSALGEPKQIYDAGEWFVYDYGRDISQKISR